MPRSKRVSDSSLVRRSQQGDRRAFRALLARYDWRLRGLAQALLLEPHRIDAVLRMAYIRAWRDVVRIHAKDDAGAWLYRVVYNACIDGLRRESARTGAAPPAGVSADVESAAPNAGSTSPSDVSSGVREAGVNASDGAGDAPESASVASSSAPAGASAAAGAAAAAESPPPSGNDRVSQRRVVEALACLTPADRVALVLVDREGFTPPAAARILGLTIEVLATRLRGARARFAQHLGLGEHHVDAAASPAEATSGPNGAGRPHRDARETTDGAAGDYRAVPAAGNDRARPAAGIDSAVPAAGNEPAAGDDTAVPTAGDDTAAAGDDTAVAAVGDDRAAPAAGDGRVVPTAGDDRAGPAAGDDRAMPAAGDDRAAPVARNDRTPPAAGNEPAAGDDTVVPTAGDDSAAAPASPLGDVAAAERSNGAAVSAGGDPGAGDSVS